MKQSWRATHFEFRNFNTLFSVVKKRLSTFTTQPFLKTFPRRQRLWDLSLCLTIPLSLSAPGPERRNGNILRILLESNPLIASTEIGPLNKSWVPPRASPRTSSECDSLSHLSLYKVERSKAFSGCLGEPLALINGEALMENYIGKRYFEKRER